jgi:hypothetical protein
VARGASHSPSVRGLRASTLPLASTSYACPCPLSRKLRARAGAPSPSTVRPFSVLSSEVDWIPIYITQRPALRANSRGSNAPSHDTSLSWQAHGARTIPLLSPRPRPPQPGAFSRATSCSRQRSSPVCFSPFSCSFPSCSSASPHSRASSHPYAFMCPRATARTRKRTSEGEEGNVMGSCKLYGDNMVVINDGGNTLADPSTTSWGKVCTLRYGEGNA